MSTESNRAYNRHQAEMALKRAEKIITVSWQINRVQDPVAFAKFSRRLRHNPKKCSCYACCNPRRSPFFKGQCGYTMQERRARLEAMQPSPIWLGSGPWLAAT